MNLWTKQYPVCQLLRLVFAAALIVIPLNLAISDAFAQVKLDGAAPQENPAHRVYQYGFSNEVPSEVRQAAADGLEPLLSSIPKKNLAEYGFSGGIDRADITFGQPYRVFTINPDVLLESENGTDIQSMVDVTPMWFFPVLQEGQVRTILTVDRMNDAWQAVAIGSSGLAMQLKEAEKNWSDESGYNRAFVRIFQARSDVMLIMKDSELNVYPFQSARISLNLEGSSSDRFATYRADKIVSNLTRVVRENLVSDNRQNME
jgi:hypothetical protein